MKIYGFVFFALYLITVEPGDWQNMFARFRYIEVLFHIFYYYWSKENVRYIWEVRYIEVPL